MKKITSLMVSLVLMALLCVTGFAATNGSIAISASSSSLYVGDVVTLTVTGKDIGNATSMGLTINYDTDKFEYVEGSGVWKIANATPVQGVDTSKPGDLFASVACSTATSANTTLFQFQLKAKDTASTTAVSVTPIVKNSSSKITVSKATASFSVNLSTPVLTGATLAPNGVTVKWNAVTGAENYRVFYKSGSGNWTAAGDTTASSYTVTGLTSGTTYTFTVRCVSADGKTYTSGFNATGKSVTYIAAPIIKSLGTSVKGVEVKWNAVGGAYRYGVFYKTATVGWTYAGQTTAGSYTVTGLTSGTNYTFTVRCMSKDGKSYTSAFDSVGKSFTYLSTPELSAASLAPNGVTLKWAAINGAEMYRVFYKAAGSGSWVVAGNTASNSYTVTGLQSGTTYTFTVRCMDAAGTVYTSGFNATGKSVTYIAAPIIKSLGTSVKGVEVKWNAVGGAYRYAVYYKTATVGWTYAGQTTAGSYTVTGLTSGTNYTFTVRCLSKDGKSYTSAFDAVGKDFTYLSTPTVSSATKSGTSAVISWGAVNGAESYRVFYKISGTSTWVSVGNTTDTTMIVPNLKAGTTYIFTVRCTDAAGTVYTSGFDSTGKTLKM